MVQKQVEEEEEEEPIQPKVAGNSSPEVTPELESRIQSLRDGGQPLPESMRSYFEPRFGYDFSQVRVYTEEKAAETARLVNAMAFTVGHDVVFGAGQYAPWTNEGQRLMAHELTHVIQQREASTNPNAPEIQRKVSRCCREVKTGESIIDTLSGLLDLKHCWLKTDIKAAGMGPAKAGPLPAWPVGTDTMITDHSGETPTNCEEIPAIDENCVNRELVIGKPTGKWSSSNNCNTLARDIINTCGGPTYGLTGDTEIRDAINGVKAATIAQIPTEEKIRIINRLLDGWVSDDDIVVIGKVYRNTLAIQRPVVKKAIEARLLDLTDIGQRTQVRVILAGG